MGRLRVGRWLPACLLIAFGVLLYTAHPVAPPHRTGAVAAPVTAGAPEPTCVDRDLAAVEGECRADDSHHQAARRTTVHTAATATPAAAGHARVAAGEPGDPGGGAERGLDRSLLQVWRT